MFAKKPDLAKEFAKETKSIKALPEKKYNGKGTKARLNTAAEKKLFGSHISK